MRENIVPEPNEIYDEKVDDLTTLLAEQGKNDERFRIIAMAGVSGSGKTSFATRLASRMNNVQVLHIDDYISLNPMTDYTSIEFLDLAINAYTPRIEGLDIRTWNIPLLTRDINRLASGQGVRVPHYDVVSQESLPHGTNIVPGKSLIVEGALSFNLSKVEVEAMDRILLRAPFHDRFIRKLVRSRRRNKQPDLNHSIKRYIEGSELAWRFYESHFTNRADVIIDNPANPRVDYMNIPSLSIATDPLTGERELSPLDTSGVSREGESLRIGKNPLGEWVLRYLVNDRVLVSSEITNSNLERVLGYYDFG